MSYSAPAGIVLYYSSVSGSVAVSEPEKRSAGRTPTWRRRRRGAQQ
jgi:hypothetical protein